MPCVLSGIEKIKNFHIRGGRTLNLQCQRDLSYHNYLSSATINGAEGAKIILRILMY